MKTRRETAKGYFKEGKNSKFGMLWIPFVITLFFILCSVAIIYYANLKLQLVSESTSYIRILNGLNAENASIQKKIYYETSLPVSEFLTAYKEKINLWHSGLSKLQALQKTNSYSSRLSEIQVLVDSLNTLCSTINSTYTASSDLSSDLKAGMRLAWEIDLKICDLFESINSSIQVERTKLSFRLDDYWQALSVIAVIACILSLFVVLALFQSKVNVERRREAEYALTEERDKYRNLVDSMEDGVLITDLEDRIIFANNAVEKLTGYKPAELDGRVAHKTFNNSSDWVTFENRLQDRIQGKSEEYMGHIYKKDNSLLKVLIKGSPFRNFKGEVIGTLGVLSDLSDQMKMEREASISRENLNGVLENSNDYIWAFDRELSLVVFNSAFKTEFKRLFKIDVSIGMKVLDHVDPVMQRGWKRVCGRALKGEKINFDQEYIVDGELNTYLVSLNPVKDSMGVISGLAVFMSDVTRRVKTEEELRAAKEIAENATKLKSVFLANMSHEIRTPLNGILGMANLLMDSDMNEYQRLYAKAIKESGSTLLGILNDILDISKVEAGKIEVIHEEFDLPVLLEGLAELFSVQAENKNISFYIESDNQIPQRIRCDRLRVNQILNNILSNAFKFTEKGYVNLQILTSWTDDLSGIIEFNVEDTGPGMDARTLAALFEAYTQGSPKVATKFGGTGLGLSISRKLAELMGGSIQVKSSVGEGSSFSIKLPFTVGYKEIMDESKKYSGQVLLVTNGHKGALIIAKMLEYYGFTPITVYNAANALVKLSRDPASEESFKFVIGNFNLPGYDGFAMMKQILENYSTPPPLFLLIGRRKYISLRNQLSKFPITVISKPFYDRSMKQIIDILYGEAEPALPITKQQPQPVRKLKLLIADDNKINRTVLTGFLHKLGHEVKEVVNGQEAVEASLREDYDVLLMDCQMPVLDGYSASRRIRELETNTGKRIPIIGVTANNSHEEKEKCLNAGMDDFLFKPFEISDLRRMLELNSVQSQVEEYTDSGFELENYQLRSLRESLDDETVEELLQLFLNDFQGYLASLSVRIESSDFKGLAAESHTIKSGCANIGAEKLKKLVEKLEHECDSSSHEEIRNHFNKMADEYIYVKQKIKKHFLNTQGG